MRRVKGWLQGVFLVLLGIGLALYSGCKGGGGTAGGGVAARYELLQVEPSSKTLESSFSATLKGVQDVAIYPQISGLITRVAVEDGARVAKGQTLFVLEQAPYRAALETAKANVQSAEAALATAQMKVESKEALQKEGVVSDYDLQTTRNALQVQQAALAQARAQLLIARNNLNYTEVKSPVDGVIGMVAYRVGALVSPQVQTPLVEVSDNAQMYAYFAMTEKQVLTLMRLGAEDAKPTASLVLNDGTVYSHEGRIDAISGIIDQKTGSVSVRALFPNPEGLLRSGGAGVVRIPYQRDGCIVIPQSATYELQDKVFVFRVVDGVTKSTEVVVLPISDGKEYIVESGLKPGDVIIAQGAGLLRDGLPVDTSPASQNTGE